MLEMALTNHQLTNLANYFVTLPSEAAASFWMVFCGKAEDDYQNPNMISFNKTQAHNGLRVAEHYATILTGNVISDNS